MILTDNTILITGGASGIGLGLAERFLELGNHVIIAGRRQSLLDETAAAHPGMHALPLDIEDPASIQSFSNELLARFPALNAVMHNAGIMRTEDLLGDPGTSDAESTVAINLLGPIRLNAALLPHLLAQPRATILTVTSGLASVPLCLNPTYCATKAAIHSWTQSLRYQLRDKPVQVIELVPPYTQTELTGPHQAVDSMAMPLADYIAETMTLLESEPDAEEILVERVKPQRFAERSGDYPAFYKKFNDTLIAVRTKR